MAAIDLKSISVLVIEDEAFMRNIILRFLQEIGVGNVYSAADGRKGLQILMEEGAKIDIILLDLHMPQIEGQDVLKYIRFSKDVADPNIPVLVITGESEEAMVKTVAALNVSGYLVKPVSKKDMTLRLVRALTLAKKSADPKSAS
ncbi:MAG: response regulator [Rhodospirillaceae bacterium]